MAKQTLEQLRAQDAWAKCKDYDSDHVNIAKGLPALIMNSGLMQVMAFLHQKQKKHEQVGRQLRQWLAKRFPKTVANSDFEPFMEDLMKASPHEFQALNAEAFAWLKWLRHMAAARKGGK